MLRPGLLLCLLAVIAAPLLAQNQCTDDAAYERCVLDAADAFENCKMDCSTPWWTCVENCFATQCSGDPSPPASGTTFSDCQVACMMEGQCDSIWTKCETKCQIEKEKTVMGCYSQYCDPETPTGE